MQSSARWMALQGRRLQSALTYEHVSMMPTLSLHPYQSFRMKWTCTLQVEDHRLKTVIESQATRLACIGMHACTLC